MQSASACDMLFLTLCTVPLCLHCTHALVHTACACTVFNHNNNNNNIPASCTVAQSKSNRTTYEKLNYTFIHVLNKYNIHLCIQLYIYMTRLLPSSSISVKRTYTRACTTSLAFFFLLPVVVVHVDDQSQWKHCIYVRTQNLA